MLIVGAFDKLKSLTIATPFYNEELGLENFFGVLKKIEKLINKKIKVKYLFIDDGSIDSTKIKLEEFKNQNPNFMIILFGMRK